MIHFLDSSALVKRYIDEEGAEQLRGVFRGRKDIAVSRLAQIEVASALARRAREGDLETAIARGAADQLARDLNELRVVEARPPVLELAGELIWRRPLRAGDALQLASALRLSQATGLALTFWCADRVLSDSARAEGLKVQLVAH